MPWNARLTGGRTTAVPANPEAWLLTVARNRMRDMWKSHAYRMTEPLGRNPRRAQPKSTKYLRYPTGGSS